MRAKGMALLTAAEAKTKATSSLVPQHLWPVKCPRLRLHPQTEHTECSVGSTLAWSRSLAHWLGPLGSPLLHGLRLPPFSRAMSPWETIRTSFSVDGPVPASAPEHLGRQDNWTGLQAKDLTGKGADQDWLPVPLGTEKSRGPVVLRG